MSETELKKTQVDLQGLMEVLGRNLYSTPTVAIRELVQNAHDSCIRRRIEGEGEFEAAIIVTSDRDRGVLAIEDRGAGLTKEEIERYLATVGAGYTRKLQKDHQDAGLIGMFGLGFLSAFIVSEKVEVYTTSFRAPGTGWHFSSRNGESYTLQETAPRAVGTKVEIHLSPNFKELAVPETTRALLERYCSLLTIPIHFGDPREPAVNATPPPWRLGEDVSSLRKKKLSLEFAKRFETFFEPICTFELGPRTDEGAQGSARGMLWIQDGATYGTSDNRNLSVFVRGMLVSTDERDLLPTYAGFVGGVVEADRLVPTASREDVQKDETYFEISVELRERLIHGLSEVAKSEPATWRRILSRHNEALLGASLCDERLFELLADELKVPTSEGDLTMPQVMRRGQNKIHVSIGDKGGYEETLFRALTVPVVSGTRYAAFPFTVRYGERHGVTVVQLGTKEGNDMLFRRESLRETEARLLEALFGEDGIDVVSARFRPDFLPLVLVPDREVMLKERIEADEADKRISTALLGMARLYTKKVEREARAQLFVNLDSEVIQRVLACSDVAARAGAAKLLTSLSRLMTRSADSLLETDLSRTLREYSEAVLSLIGPGVGAGTGTEVG
jgi:molecular chaperone HtpG